MSNISQTYGHGTLNIVVRTQQTSCDTKYDCLVLSLVVYSFLLDNAFSAVYTYIHCYIVFILHYNLKLRRKKKTKMEQIGSKIFYKPGKCNNFLLRDSTSLACMDLEKNNKSWCGIKSSFLVSSKRYCQSLR